MDKRRTTYIAVDAKDINAILNSPTGTNTLVDLSLDGEPACYHEGADADILVSDRYLHVDFLRSPSQKDLNFRFPLFCR